MQIYKPNLFNNPNITYKFNDKNPDIDDTPIKQLSFHIEDFSIDDLTLEKKILNTLKQFRHKNIKSYEFTLICPVCLEESHDINFLFGLTDEEHICCYDCWKDHCLQTIKTSHYKIKCIECDKEINLQVFYDLFKFDLNIMNNYNLRLYQNKHHDLIDCPKCKLKFIANNDIHNKCPGCYYDICKYCLELNHYELNLTCQEFENFIKTTDYIKYFNYKENERILKLRKEKYNRDFIDFKAELILKTKSRKQRIKEEKRQIELSKNEKENLKWIIDNTKKCPNCGNAIEKNKGCNHMTCKCKYEFCWYCLEECKNPCDHFKICKAGAKWFDDNYKD